MLCFYSGVFNRHLGWLLWVTRKWNSVVGVVIILQTRWQRNCNLIPGRDKRFFLISKSIQMRSGCTLFCVHWGSGVKWPGREADYLFPSNAEVKNGEEYTATFPYSFLVLNFTVYLWSTSWKDFRSLYSARLLLKPWYRVNREVFILETAFLRVFWLFAQMLAYLSLFPHGVTGHFWFHCRSPAIHIRMQAL